MPEFFFLEMQGVNGYTTQSGNPAALNIPENIATGTIVAKITGWEPGEDHTRFDITPLTDPGAAGDDFGRYGIMQATTNGPGSPPQWNAGDWVVYIKNGGPINFNSEDKDGPNDLWYNQIDFKVTPKSGYTPIAEYEVKYTFNIQNANDAPTDLQYATVYTLNENASQGDVIATGITVTDEDQLQNFRDFRYALVNSDGSPYTGTNYQINSTTGVITVGPGGLPDVTVPTPVTLHVRVTDMGGAGASYRESVTFTVNPVATNDPPSNPAVQGTVATLDEEATIPATTVIARVQSTDDGIGGALRYELVSNPGGLFGLDAQTGEIRFTGGRQDYENNANLQVESPGTPQERKFFNVTVRAVESGQGGLQSGTTQVKVYLNNVNDAPRAWLNTVDNNQVTIQENRPTNFQVAQLVASDPDGNHPQWGGPFTYRIDTTDSQTPYASLYDIVSNGGVWTLVVKGTIDYDALPAGQKRHLIKIIARDNSGAEGSQYVTINLTNDPSDDQSNNPPTAPTIVGGNVLALTEDLAGTVNVATVQSTDDGFGGTTLGYELLNTFGGLFSVNSSGVITFNGTAQNYENNPNLMVEDAGTAQERKYFNVQVRARESGTGGLTSAPTTVKVYLNDRNEAISDATYNVSPISENANVGATVGTVQSITDPDTAPATRNYQYTLVDRNGVEITGAYNFAVNAATGAITVGQLGLPDVNQPTDVEVYVRIADGSFSHTETVTVRINPVTASQNQAPNDILVLSGGTVQELAGASSTGANTVVATLGAQDPNDTSGFVYSIVNPDGRFAISGNQIVVANGVMLDAEQSLSHVVRVRVTDKSGAGLSYEENITINVADINPETMLAASASPLNDVIKGSKTGNFKDTFFGGLGDDKLWGGYGNDTLWGGVGKDVFVFDGKLGTSSTDRRVNYDTIKDYSVKDDSIWLDNDLFKSNKKLYGLIKKGTEIIPLKMDKKFFTVGAKAKDQDDYFVYDSKKRVLYYDADGSGSKAAIEMANFTNNKALRGFNHKEVLFI
ncbi:hypothetical protein [Microvirga arsenatis]|uniref:Cadherin domain-containing protein n=1 Tax=Microvirga arsenatis TaxID=2692265 RepID=A0ABW9YT67_9HYPH|nr:hypothetical protein [Microvirga arsenatis]NBJ12463.1 hypothetical protein [Microvirga arsenatis]NBJ23339.1 hypothetical protein [Microvirga arsenatis]